MITQRLKEFGPESFNYCHQTNHNINIDPKENDNLVRLWRHVIIQAFSDLNSNSRKTFLQSNRQKAKKWLTGYGQNFLMVCSLAELDPFTVATKAWQIIKIKNL